MTTKLSITRFDVAGPALIQPMRLGDERGYFCETWHVEDWQAAGLPAHDWVQDNEALSEKSGTVRGLHFQATPFAQAKLIRVIQGAIFDVAVDIRRGSPTYGHAITVRLDSKTGNQFYVPRGFAHGYQTLSDDTLITYKCDGLYNQDAESGLLWSDVDLAIAWPITDPSQITLSARDKTLSGLAALQSPFAWTT